MNPAALREQLAPLVANYPHPQAALVPALHLLRDQGSPINDETLPVIADVCGVEARQITELLGHYAIFQNPSPTCASLCMGLICYLRGAKEILDQLKAEPPCDSRLEQVKVSSCLGYCHAAPVIKLSDDSICKITKTN
ncbi:MAG TPA: NAD(P)H-dependent oxidoreductase subunit E [Pyrinomonadaceae bacterium]|jgi:NADH:ubiquinone oxidoreductase subunit E|nr:NAD(P)H-dependent oxidoreductase subunit E [Pyrinomonadaceae bacterium]